MNIPRPIAETSPPPEAILEAALDEFADRGYPGARIDEIARRAGVNKAGLYYHVGNKETLYLLSLRRIFSPLAAVMAAPAPEGSPEERLRFHVARFAEGIVSDRRFAPIMLRELADHGANMPKEILAVMVSSLKRLTGVVDDGVAAGRFRPFPPPLIHFMLVGALNLSVVTAPVRARAESEGLASPAQVALPDAATLAAQMAELFLNGLRADRKE
ncbi:MAG: TetR/AcrR family transcriptional regulator [Nitrospinae bacterium]|nr:TetR/AcrR family transcriptional regulator [Nitrospinota bacterium]